MPEFEHFVSLEILSVKTSVSLAAIGLLQLLFLVCSQQDLQLRAQLRWVSSGDFGIKVRAQTSLGVGCTIEVSALEIDFPVWVQVVLQVSLALFCPEIDMP